MRISVVMAVRNGEPYLREAIESVLAQSVADFEFIIVDDASTDDTPRILAEYQRQDSRIRVLRNEKNLGPFPSANRGLMHARGDFIARHDADDISPPERFAIQLEALESDPATSLATGAYEVFGRDGQQPNRILSPPSWQPRLEWELLFHNVVGAGAHVMFPRVIRGKPVFFPAKYRYAEDYGMWCQLSGLGRVACPAQVIYRYRQHGSSITSLKRAEQHECFSEMRHEYQSHYLRSEVSQETLAELSRFWIPSGGRPIGASLDTIDPIFIQLRCSFLDYVEQRYGRVERDTLAAELDRTFRERLGFWLFRSIRFLDAKACSTLVSISLARREALHVCGIAAAHLAGAFVRRSLRPQYTDRSR